MKTSEKRISSKELKNVAYILNLDEPTLQRKFSNLDFNVGEIMLIKDTFRLNDRQTCEMFGL